jgi:thiosulfate/3-mercaptopyruvate sulfurtransferase
LKKNVQTKISTSPRVIPLCAAWFMPNDPEGRKGIDVYKQQRIPQSRFFDIDEVKDPDSPYPHMLPNKERFADAMQAMGIRRDDAVVVYDTAELGLFSAPRVGWTLKYFGHPAVHILNNFRLWVQQGYPTESGEPAVEDRSTYTVDTVNTGMVIDFPELKGIAQDAGKEGSDGIQILDARPYGRWAGTDKEPREGLSSGHMPGSKSLPFGELLDPETKTLLPVPQLKKVLESKGLDPDSCFVSSCGSGVTAAVIDLALSEAGYGDSEGRRLYDGSWT